VKKDKL